MNVYAASAARQADATSGKGVARMVKAHRQWQRWPSQGGHPVPTKLHDGNVLSHCNVTVGARRGPTNQRLLFRVIPLNRGHDFGAGVSRFSPAKHLHKLARL